MSCDTLWSRFYAHKLDRHGLDRPQVVIQTLRGWRSNRTKIVELCSIGDDWLYFSLLIFTNLCWWISSSFFTAFLLGYPIRGLILIVLQSEDYVPKTLVSKAPIFPGMYVPRIIYSQGLMFPGTFFPITYIPEALFPRIICSQSLVFPASYVPKVLYTQSPIFPW